MIGTSVTSNPYNLEANWAHGTSIAFDNSDDKESEFYNYLGTDISLEKYSEVESLNQKFHFDSENVDTFLIGNSSLINFLQRAHQQLSKILPGSLLLLEVANDYEVDEWKTLFIYVINNIQDKSFDKKLDDFILNWMFMEDPSIRKLVTIKEIC